MISFSTPGSSNPFWKRFMPLFGAGVLGIAASAPLVSQIVASAVARAPGAAPMPMPVLVGISLAQTAVLVAAAVAAGVSIAPRLGLRSYLAERQPLWQNVRRDLPLAVSVGAATGTMLIVADLAFKAWTGTALLAMSQDQRAAATSIQGLLARFLYGGITEEVLLRWGVMSVLAWLMWRIWQREQTQPRPTIIWIANMAAAILFGVGHIPAAAALLTLSAPLVVQIVVVNALAGVAFGWLYWRRSLEAAMVAHAMAHVVFITRGILGVIQG